MYQLTEVEVKQINDILDACDEHPQFVNGKDVAAIASILLRMFKEDIKPSTKKTQGKKSPVVTEGS